MPEAAVYRIFILATSATSDVNLPEDSAYSNYRWVARRRDLEVVTFATDQTRQLAIEVLDWANNDAVSAD